MAGDGGGRRRSEGATPRAARRSPRGLVASAPRGGPPWAPLPRRTQSSPLGERPLPSRRSPRLRSQKENVPAAAPPPPSPPPPCAPPAPPPSPSPPAVAPRVRRSYSRLEAAPPPRGLGGAPLSPRPPNAAPPPPPAPPGPERRRKKKVAPIDLGELEAWAARMNAQFEEAERFRLVVE